jgi:hypothetical protein
MMAESTFHPDTRTLLAYSRALNGQSGQARGLGAKSADRLAERLFVLDRRTYGVLALRTFGGELASLFGADLRGRDFASLWSSGDQILVRAFSETIAAVGQPGVIQCLGETAEGRRLGLEVALAPLTLTGGVEGRQLGFIQPLGGEDMMRGRAVARLVLAALHPPMARAHTGPRLVVSNS